MFWCLFFSFSFFLIGICRRLTHLRQSRALTVTSLTTTHTDNNAIVPLTNVHTGTPSHAFHFLPMFLPASSSSSSSSSILPARTHGHHNPFPVPSLTHHVSRDADHHVACNDSFGPDDDLDHFMSNNEESQQSSRPFLQSHITTSRKESSIMTSLHGHHAQRNHDLAQDARGQQAMQQVWIYAWFFSSLIC